MGEPEFIAEKLKQDLLSGRISSSTVASLQSLLRDPQTSTTDETKEKRSTASKTSNGATEHRRTRPLHNDNKQKRAVQVKHCFTIHAEEAVGLAPKAKIALATTVINKALQAFTEAKRKRKLSTPTVRRQPGNPSSPGRQHQSPAPTPRALKSRSINATQTSRSRPPKAAHARAPQSEVGEEVNVDQDQLRALAESARLAIQCIRAPTTGLASDRTVKPQVEATAIALIEFFIALDMSDLALCELQTTKMAWESLSGHAKPSSRKIEVKPTLSDLLDLELDLDLRADLLPVAITYKLLVLQILCNSQSSGVSSQTYELLSLDCPSSPANLILLQNSRFSSPAKAATQLEKLAWLVAVCCPIERGARNEKSPRKIQAIDPVTAFKFQSLAMQIQQLAGTISGIPTSDDQMLLKSLLLSINALIRRNSIASQSEFVYASTKEACRLVMKRVEPTIHGTEYFHIYRALSSLAERASQLEEAFQWIDAAVKASLDLGKDHPLHLAAVTYRIALSTRSQDPSTIVEALQSDLGLVRHGLGSVTETTVSNYNLLLHDLYILNTQTDKVYQTFGATAKALLLASASFASNLVRRSDKVNLEEAQEIILAALSRTTTKEASQWLSRDSTHVFIACGVLREVATAAATRSLNQAWTVSRYSIALRSILKILISAQTQRDFEKEHKKAFYDDAGLASEERGVLLEWQLRSASELCTKPSHADALQELIPTLLLKLHDCYTQVEYPVRRKRVANVAFRMCSHSPGMIPMETLEMYGAMKPIEALQLGKDQGLERYLTDIEASMSMTLAFCHSPPLLTQLEEPLSQWQTLFDSLGMTNALEEYLDDPETLHSQLALLCDYLCVVDEDEERLRVTQLLLRVSQTSSLATRRHEASLRLARAHLALGQSKKAAQILDRVQVTGQDLQELDSLSYSLTKSLYHLTSDDLDSCRQALAEAQSVATRLDISKFSNAERMKAKLLNGQAWLIFSQYCTAIASSFAALSAAKRAVRILNSLWKSLEDAPQIEGHDWNSVVQTREETALTALTRGISKLNLEKTTLGSPDGERNAKPRGGSFWFLVPLVRDAMTHLADIYARNGIFTDAIYYSELAKKTSVSCGLASPGTRQISLHSKLLIAGGRIEDAELCQATNCQSRIGAPSLRAIELLEAQAVLKMRERSFEKSLQLLAKAQQAIDFLLSNGFVADESSKDKTVHTRPAQDPNKSQKDKPNKKHSRLPPNTAQKKQPVKSNNKINKAMSSPKVAASDQLVSSGGDYALQSVRMQLLLKEVTVLLAMGRDAQSVWTKLLQSCGSIPISSTWRRTDHLIKMQKVNAAFLADLSLSTLSETTLASPFILNAREVVCGSDEQGSTQKLATGRKLARTREYLLASDSQNTDHIPLENLLLAARSSLTKRDAVRATFEQTADVHLESLLKSNVSILLAACFPNVVGQSLSLGQSLECSRMYATSCRSVVADCDRTSRDSLRLEWPSTSKVYSQSESAIDDFQEKYVDILPKPWTAVSLGLNEACDELYVARYRREKTPLVLRLPFARHKASSNLEETFDYHTVRSDLNNIIDLSNYSCHHAGDASMTGAKTKWWKERETLDLQLQNLIVNVENIWFGGFKGILSQKQACTNELNRFRKMFDSIMNRHLPSRQAPKRGSNRLVLDDQILELFVGLGADPDESVDLGDSVSDLLYFVIEMLHFSGEHNAYDEIDIDRMIVETLDALRDYHDSVGDEDSNSHLILVLDRRLQAFPWESLPCLEGESVSRVDSMLTLRERILAMQQRRHKDQTKGQKDDDLRYTVSRNSGSCILNPSGDLANTEATLGPVLPTSSEEKGSGWTHIICRGPSEQEFVTALSTSSNFLYFGHGPGTQYIRTRAIKRLDDISEVVWLMGCSSGAVTEHGDFEPSVVPLDYLIAGRSSDRSNENLPPEESRDHAGRQCMAIVATLWDVTDKDIDRFSLAAGDKWGLWIAPNESSRPPTKAVKKREATLAPSTPKQPLQAPKTPKVQQTPMRPQKSARNRVQSSTRGNGARSLAAAVASSRDACYLRYLNGAAPVVFGVPVFLGD